MHRRRQHEAQCGGEGVLISARDDRRGPFRQRHGLQGYSSATGRGAAAAVTAGAARGAAATAGAAAAGAGATCGAASACRGKLMRSVCEGAGVTLRVKCRHRHCRPAGMALVQHYPADTVTRG